MKYHVVYCKTLNIHGIKFLQFYENYMLVHFNFGVHDIPWFKIVKMYICTILFDYTLCHLLELPH